ncbi:MAG TPA: MFS transporter [Actinocrinis sp.]|jgi:EmrB/QacA subfamily drug resistance transporter
MTTTLEITEAAPGANSAGATSAAAAETKAEAAAAAPRPHRWLGLTAILAATLLDLLDSTIMNVASPTIHRSLGGGTEALQWFSAAYTLAFAAGLLVGGRLGDKVGRKPMLLWSAVGFTLASVACAAAWSPESLIVARGVQGLLAAMMVPQTFGLIRDLFPGRETMKAFGIFGPSIGLATILGPVVAGVLVDANLLGSGWRAVFLINVPVGVFTVVVGIRTLPAPAAAGRAARRALKVDGRSALLGAVAMSMLVYPLIQGRESGWPAWSLILPAASLAVFALFGLRQRALSRSGRHPLVLSGVFANRSYTAGLAFIVVFFGAIIGFALSVGMFLQLGLGYTPMHAALVTASSAGGAFVGSALSAIVGARLGRRILHLGLTVAGAGIVGFCLVLNARGAAVTGWDLAAPLGGYGLGMGAIFVPLFDIVLGKVRDEHLGSASGVLETVQQLGACLGVAVLGTVFFDRFGVHAAAAALPAVHAAEQVALLALGLAAVAFVLVFQLPRAARGESDE